MQNKKNYVLSILKVTIIKYRLTTTYGITLKKVKRPIRLIPSKSKSINKKEILRTYLCLRMSSKGFDPSVKSFKTNFLVF